MILDRAGSTAERFSYCAADQHLRTMGTQASDGVVDVADGEHDPVQAQGVRGRGRRVSAHRGRRPYLVNSNRPDPSGVHIMTI